MTMNTNTNPFDHAAATWDEKPHRVNLALDIIKAAGKNIAFNESDIALEYGCGTGIASVIISEKVKEITAMDSSEGMIEEVEKKVKSQDKKNIIPKQFDLLHKDFNEKKFDIIYTAMTMHHINDVDTILKKFHSMLNASGRIAIADLDTEDGSFHGTDTETAHKGFDRKSFMDTLEKIGFSNMEATTASEVERFNEDGSKRGDFSIFLITAEKN
jgi:ubiquinone/menaquinone biosynthesis C-methylase UbiE